eukprot:CAMPEP_0202729196 /NCGR_PEP_ID=MMETSP1385-20130828/186010_1 /ASSEMBLY_ACC=CAM_ASM_000861 /TAXON_ID=933848 /ORGANISM="Elphidium margaritaceum" /LENGTH=421 /DNA_ID=CAMNT_0049395453 /DNA_START=45 /DNA_END=1311 /DNA_ORIENTATION=+
MFALSTAAFVALATIQSAYGASRFVIDDDWAFGMNTAFPVEQCIQVAPTGLELGGIYEQFLFYECNADGSLTKYKWQASGSLFSTNPLTDEQRSCSERSSAEQTVITSATAGSTACDLYHFNCVGEDNYAQVRYYGVFQDTTTCPSTPNFDMIFTIATDVCQCDADTQTSATIQCDVDTVSVYSYSTPDCSGDGEYALHASAAEECTYITTIRDQVIPVSLFNGYHQCTGTITTSTTPSPVSTTGASSSTADTGTETDAPIIPSYATTIATKIDGMDNIPLSPPQSTDAPIIPSYATTIATKIDGMDIYSSLATTESGDDDEDQDQETDVMSTDANEDVDEEYYDDSFMKTDSIIHGVKNLYVIIGATVVLFLVLLACVAACFLSLKSKRLHERERTGQTAVPDDVDEDASVRETLVVTQV